MARRHGWIPKERKLAEGRRIAELRAAGLSIAEAARVAGLAPTTAWRRSWFAYDWDHGGKQARRIPRQRGTVTRPPLNPRRRPDGRFAPAPPKEPSFFEIYGLKLCPRCDQHYAGQRPCCPRCGPVPASR
jgi:hypothetical protein